MSQIYFHVASNFSSELLVEFCSNKLGIRKDAFVVVESFVDACLGKEFDQQKYYIEYAVRSGEFDAFIEIHTNDDGYKDINQRVEFLKDLCMRYNQQILMCDESANPYAYLLIDENGDCSSIVVDPHSLDERDEMNFREYHNTFFGAFATQKKKEIEFLKVELSQLFRDQFSEFNLHYYNDQGEDTSFTKSKLIFPNLREYQHHYTIIPIGKQRWYSIKEKSKMFIDKMRLFSGQNDMGVCLFPADFSTVKSIKGGSDSEEYCLHYSQATLEKIIYKRPRKSW